MYLIYGNLTYGLLQLILDLGFESAHFKTVQKTGFK